MKIDYKTAYENVMVANKMLEKEIERLNNIINELEKCIKEGIDLETGCGITREYIYAYENMLDKLQELKGSE